MTIKRQFTLLIIAIICFPLACALFIPVYQYATLPERAFLHGRKRLSKPSTLPVSEEDWKKIHRILHQTLPGVDIAIAVIKDFELDISYSSIEELHQDTSITTGLLWTFIRSTTKTHFYQLDTLDFPSTEYDILVITRLKKSRRQSASPELSIFTYMIFALAIFSLITIILIVSLSNNIFSSITLLEKKARNMLDSSLNDKIESEIDASLEDIPKSNEIIMLFNHFESIHKKLTEAQKTRFDFITGMSHDLRTPIAVIRGYTEALNENLLSTTEEKQEAFRIIEDKTILLESRIDTLINFVKLENASAENAMVITNIKTVTDKFLKNAVSIGVMLKHNVICENTISRQLLVKMNASLYIRVLENIFYNAINYSSNNSNITIRASEDNDNFFISIQDEGVGISEEEIENIFKPLYRASKARQEKGIGMGLAVVKNIADLHGWKITVKSKLNIGSTFTVIIPKHSET